MASPYQPLLDTPKSTTFSSKTLYYFVISLLALILSAASLIPNLTNTSYSDSHLSIPPYICNKAHDPRSCLNMVSEALSREEVSQLIGTALLQKSLMKYVNHMESAIEVASQIKHRINDYGEQVALADCVELIDLSIDRVTDTVAALANWTILSHSDAQAWLSGVLINHVTCLDGLHALGRSYMETNLGDLISRAKASLAILAAVYASNEEMLLPPVGKFPAWVMPMDRKLLANSAKDIKADVVVAQDGSGSYRTVSEAVASAPDESKNRYVIHVKRGTYKENVQVGKEKKNLMIIGDGMNLTIITGSLNVIDGSTTFKSATLAAVGDGFILQDIWVQNTAGPEKHEAVALRVGADQSVINRCRIDAYQDTLYAHSLRQFYRNCTITGTIDFIFGNAAVVLQNCSVMANKNNVVTAQGYTDPNQNTGISIQDYDMITSSDFVPAQTSFPIYLGAPVQSSFPIYFGAPWNLYTRSTAVTFAHRRSYISLMYTLRYTF